MIRHIIVTSGMQPYINELMKCITVVLKHSTLQHYSVFLGLKALIYSSPKNNSYENEYSLLYAFLNIININRSQIRNKQPLRDKLFWTFFFCTPSPEYIVCGTRISPTGLLYYRKVNIDKAVYEITHLSDINKHIDEPEIGQINKILSVAYNYLTGKELFMPQYRYMDVYGYYFFNPLDYIK